MKCLERHASKANGGESQRNNKKKKTKPGRIHNVKEANTAKTIDKTSSPMFTVVILRGGVKN